MTTASSKAIRVAIAGVGNCAQAMLEGIEHYRQHPDDARGLMYPDLGGYAVTDIVPVAAFDINANKVGKDLSEAIYGEPNNAYRYPGVEMKPTGVTVMASRGRKPMCAKLDLPANIFGSQIPTISQTSSLAIPRFALMG